MEDDHFKIFERWLPFLTAVPYTRELRLVGSLANATAGPESDIDLTIIAKQNRVWFNRVLLNLAAALIGRRRNSVRRAGCFCFNASLGDNSPQSKIGLTKKIIEAILEITFLGFILEKISRHLLTKYIHNKFKHFKNKDRAVLCLEDNKIVYHPPR